MVLQATKEINNAISLKCTVETIYTIGNTPFELNTGTLFLESYLHAITQYRVMILVGKLIKLTRLFSQLFLFTFTSDAQDLHSSNYAQIYTLQGVQKIILIISDTFFTLLNEKTHLSFNQTYANGQTHRHHQSYTIAPSNPYPPNPQTFTV